MTQQPSNRAFTMAVDFPSCFWRFLCGTTIALSGMYTSARAQQSPVSPSNCTHSSMPAI